MDFKQYKRTNIAEMRPVTAKDMENYLSNTTKPFSLSEVDAKNGSPKIGDMIARNPLDHEDQWLVAEKYFGENFEEA